MCRYLQVADGKPLVDGMGVREVAVSSNVMDSPQLRACRCICNLKEATSTASRPETACWFTGTSYHAGSQRAGSELSELAADIGNILEVQGLEPEEGETVRKELVDLLQLAHWQHHT
eukprot:881539-Rhodomonas_salina.1